MDQTILERGCVTQVKDYGDYFAGSCTEAASTARNSKFGENPIHASGDLSKFGKQQVGSELPAGGGGLYRGYYRWSDSEKCLIPHRWIHRPFSFPPFSAKLSYARSPEYTWWSKCQLVAIAKCTNLLIILKGYAPRLVMRFKQTKKQNDVQWRCFSLGSDWMAMRSNLMLSFFLRNCCYHECYL